MNAPRELADLLSRWQTLAPGQNVYLLHDSSSAGLMDSEGWKRHVRGVELWRQVDQALSSMEAVGRRTEHYRRWQAEWLVGIFVPDRLWGENAPHGVALVTNQGAIDALSGLADVLEVDLERYQIPDSSRSKSASALDEILSLIENGEINLQEHERRYVISLVDSIRSLLNEASIFGGLGDLRQRINELVGVLSSIADQLDADGHGPLAVKLRKAARDARPWVVAGGVIALNGIGLAADIQQLTGG